MLVYRISQVEYAEDLSGFGAKTYGGRWNNIGTAMVYTSESRALSILEFAVHRSIQLPYEHFRMITIHIDKKCRIKEVSKSTLPLDWNHLPPGREIRQFGDQFIKEGKYDVLKVPSAIVAEEHNYLLQPNAVSEIKISIRKIEKLAFDQRISL